MRSDSIVAQSAPSSPAQPDEDPSRVRTVSVDATPVPDAQAKSPLDVATDCDPARTSMKPAATVFEPSAALMASVAARARDSVVRSPVVA
jgi:hypothetical protein